LSSTLPLHDALPISRHDLVASALAPLASPPDTAVAVLHGILVGPVAPTKDERRAIEVPALVIGHRADLIHPFSDAEALARQMPNATLVQAHSIVELRLRPGRLMGEIDRFLAGVWADEELPAAAGH